MAERINGTIETQISEGNTLVSQYSDSQMLQTVIQNVPQVQTVLSEGINVSSVINAPFVEVTSVNGMSGDIRVDPIVRDFESNHYYLANTLINYNDVMYFAKQNFTSGNSFDSSDWTKVEGGSAVSWNDITGKPTFATVATSGSYNDLSDKPTIPTVNNATLTITQNGQQRGTFTANASQNTTINLLDSFPGEFIGATSLADGDSGLVPAPLIGDQDKVLKGDGTWGTIKGGTTIYITDKQNSAISVSDTYPTMVRIFTDPEYTTDITISEIVDILKEGSVNVILDPRYGTVTPGIMSSVYGGSGTTSFCVFIQDYLSQASAYKMMMFTSVFNIYQYTGIFNTFAWRGSDITPASSSSIGSGTLTIKHNGTTVQTFSANSSTSKTANIETIYADDYIDTTSLSPIVSSSMIEDGAVTARKLDISTVMEAIYPVGSIYMSATMSTVIQVQTAFGGTWVAWGVGRVPVGVDTSQTEFDTVEETGGEKTHQLTIAEMPSHNHSKEFVDTTSGGSGYGKRNGFYYNGGWWGNYDSVTNTGGDGAHNNLQPYITCYMYKRTA